MSWFNPKPPDAPVRLPRRLPVKTIPSFIGESGQVLNLLMHHGGRDIVRDYSPNGNHGVIHGSSWRDGSYGWCLYFDGDDYVDCGVFHTDEITFIAWVRPDEETFAEHRPLIGDYDGVDREVQFFGVGTTNYYRLRIDTVAGYDVLDSSPFNVADTWFHLGITFNGTVMKILINGSVDAQKNHTNPGNIANTGNRRYVGYWPGPPARFFLGSIALPQMYNVDKGESFIRNHFEQTRSIFGI